ncbi:sperm flagellar protein 1-like [Hylaeus volcanicus]|uniref:sperm flagellar protein 1-like n=1 Tax=Hylaeus volcanicus TaxID=313075 RepID=UPI0023B83BEF|nr:sperm flagellar protein 1-like [Hylaeus volcanicus]XP_053973867.1 sperm flagellar protein 1-like [Hylaeus volcanicus]XP_053973877.1 sperm flagellar protein 1-like [Hylaeus volcanicus]
MSLASETGDNLEEIYIWIEQMTFSRPKKNLARDFSDGVFMAELLKRYYPRHVDIHNYIPGNSTAKKIVNWCTLNRKVLSKLDIKLGKDVIYQLANSQPGVIEKVLTDVRIKILKDCNADRDSLYSAYEEDEKGEAIKSILNSDEIANKTVPRQVFIKLKQQLEEKNEVINSLQQKVVHLETLMKLKDQRIADLSTQVIKPTEPCPTPNTISKFRVKT